MRLGGGPWQDAELAAVVNIDTWRMWRAEADLPPGSHTVQVRATDRTGATQTEEWSAPPIRDGACGWQSTASAPPDPSPIG